MRETILETDELAGSKGSMSWHQDPTWSTQCVFVEALPVTPYTPSGCEVCGEATIGFVWWGDFDAEKSISVCLNHFLMLYDADGDWKAAGGHPSMFGEVDDV